MYIIFHSQVGFLNVHLGKHWWVRVFNICSLHTHEEFAYKGYFISDVILRSVELIVNLASVVMWLLEQQTTFRKKVYLEKLSVECFSQLLTEQTGFLKTVTQWNGRCYFDKATSFPPINGQEICCVCTCIQRKVPLIFIWLKPTCTECTGM